VPTVNAVLCLLLCRRSHAKLVENPHSRDGWLCSERSQQSLTPARLTSRRGTLMQMFQDPVFRTLARHSHRASLLTRIAKVPSITGKQSHQCIWPCSTPCGFALDNQEQFHVAHLESPLHTHIPSLRHSTIIRLSRTTQQTIFNQLAQHPAISSRPPPYRNQL
jgi:hypothetical protein